MPLYEYDEKTLRGELQRLRLHKVHIQGFVKYLGIFIGPDAHIHCWLGAMMKFLERIFTVKEMKGGAIQIILLFNTTALPYPFART